MADLDNLLDELDNDEGESIGSNVGSRLPAYVHDRSDGGDEPERANVPSALAAAAAKRRLNEEQNYQSQGGDAADYADIGDGDGERMDHNPDYEQLKALWTSELACPELLPHDAENTAQIAEDLARQEDAIDEMLQMSRRQRKSREASGELASLVAQITKMDMDRTRFVLVDLARSRMAKIENHALHNRSLLDRMTEEETSYLRRYGELLEKHFRRTVLDHLPKEAWKKLDEPEMIDSPDLEQFVFCRVLETVRIDVAGDPGALNEDLGDEEDQENFGDNIQDHQAGSCLIVMYKNVMELVLEGKVELLM